MYGVAFSSCRYLRSLQKYHEAGRNGVLCSCGYNAGDKIRRDLSSWSRYRFRTFSNQHGIQALSVTRTPSFESIRLQSEHRFPDKLACFDGFNMSQILGVEQSHAASRNSCSQYSNQNSLLLGGDRQSHPDHIQTPQFLHRRRSALKNIPVLQETDDREKQARRKLHLAVQQVYEPQIQQRCDQTLLY